MCWTSGRARGRREQRVDFVARIDDDALSGPLAADDEPVLVKRRDGSDFDESSRLQSRLLTIYDVLMILCVVDDLIFSVKISTAANTWRRTCSSSVGRRCCPDPGKAAVAGHLRPEQREAAPARRIAAMKVRSGAARDSDARLRITRSDGHDHCRPRRWHRSGARAFGVLERLGEILTTA